MFEPAYGGLFIGLHFRRFATFRRGHTAPLHAHAPTIRVVAVPLLLSLKPGRKARPRSSDPVARVFWRRLRAHAATDHERSQIFQPVPNPGSRALEPSSHRRNRSPVFGLDPSVPRRARASPGARCEGGAGDLPGGMSRSGGNAIRSLPAIGGLKNREPPRQGRDSIPEGRSPAPPPPARPVPQPSHPARRRIFLMRRNSAMSSRSAAGAGAGRNRAGRGLSETSSSRLQTR